MFKNRVYAGRRLAEKLAKYRGQNAVVLALPRGGVVIGREIAQALGLPLDIAVVRKIGHPLSPEYAIGAVDDTGAIILNDAETESVSQAWLSDEIEREKKEAERRVKAYRGGRKPIPILGKTALIVDDGIATGLTMRLRVRPLRAGHTAGCRVFKNHPLPLPALSRRAGSRYRFSVRPRSSLTTESRRD